MARDYVLQRFRPVPDLRIDYAAELNPAQLAAVTAPPGPALVIAGAGAGKTRTLTYRVAYLLEQGVPADRILLLTFTNKAAREMMNRVADLIGADISHLWGGTFHSIGNRILRQHADRLKFTSGFSILDREDAKDLLQACLDSAEIDIKATRFPKAEVLVDIFSKSVNTERSVARVLQEDHRAFQHLTETIEDLQRRYAARKQAAGAMDFDDLLAFWLRLLRDHEDLRTQYQQRFQFLLVDEYQDTNRIQADLIDLLAARHHNLMVVGDDSQSIYSWRGASFQNILRFPERYPEATLYKIETNYRSTPEILTLANAVIAVNRHQFPKQLAPVRAPGPKPVVVPCDDAREQAQFVGQRLLELRDEGVALNRTAVLYRSHFHALELQLELTARNIPFSITSGIRFFEQAHVKDVAAYLRLVCNPQDELAFKRIVRLLPGVGGKTADQLWRGFTTARAAPATGVAVALEAVREHVPRKSQVAWAQFTATLAQLEAPAARDHPADLIHLVIDAGYEDHLKEHFANHRARLEDLQQLAEFARSCAGTEEFLAQLALLTNVEADHARPAPDDHEQVRLSTVHQAKGLEFDVVFVIMLCEGLFPSARSLETPEGEEEERRLFYVALTRARNELYLSFPLTRSSYGGARDTMHQASRYLADLPPELRDEWRLRF